MRSFNALFIPLVCALLARASCEGRTKCSGIPIPSPLTPREPNCQGRTKCSGIPVSTPTVEKRAGPTQVLGFKTWKPVEAGCWSDNNRAMATYSTYNKQTVEGCLAYCEQKGYFLGAVENGKVCACGNTVFGNNRPVAGSLCNKPCIGNANEQCGGSGAMNLYVRGDYQVSTGPATRLAGYKNWAQTQCLEQDSGRLLKGSPSSNIPAALMTVQKCIDGCAAAGYTTAGLEDGEECTCGNGIPSGVKYKPVTDCSLPCDGDGATYCGGQKRVLIYQKTQCPALTNSKGRIQITNKSDGSLLGYISAKYDDQNSYTFTTNINSALQVSLPSLSPFNGPFDITATNGPDPHHVLVGAVGGSGGYHLESGALDYTYLAGTGHTAAGSKPSFTAGSSLQSLSYNGPVESQIWSLDCHTHVFSAIWTNADGSHPAATTIWYNPSIEYLGLAGDVTEFNAMYNERGYAVTFKFVPL